MNTQQETEPDKQIRTSMMHGDMKDDCGVKEGDGKQRMDSRRGSLMETVWQEGDVRCKRT